MCVASAMFACNASCNDATDAKILPVTSKVTNMPARAQLSRYKKNKNKKNYILRRGDDNSVRSFELLGLPVSRKVTFLTRHTLLKNFFSHECFSLAEQSDLDDRSL